MEKARQVLLALLVLSLVSLIAVGCGGEDEATTTTEPEGEETATTEAEGDTETTEASGMEDLPEMSARLGSVQPVESLYTGALNDMSEKVSEKTDGRFTLEIFPAQQLGNARELVESTQSGALEAVQVAAANFASFQPNMSIPGLPYLLTNWDDVDDILLNGPEGREILDSLESEGLKGGAWWPVGFNVFTSNFRLETPQDLDGKKIRVIENPILIAQFEAFGATPVPVNFGELYNALQQGVVDGQENPIGGNWATKLYEVQDYMTLTNHALFTLAVAYNKDWFDGLPEPYQTALIEAAEEAGAEMRRAENEMIKETMIPDMEAAGLEIIELTEDERNAFAEVAGPAAEEALRNILSEEGNSILDDMKASMGN